MIRDDTPVEEYKLGRLDVHVKRDDLMGDNERLPPWGKLLGIKKLLRDLSPDKPVVHLNVFGSWSGWALAKLHKAPVHVVHPKTKKISNTYLERVVAAGGNLHPIRHNVMKVLYSQARIFAEQNDYQMMPYAFDAKPYIDSMDSRITDTLNDLEHIDALVVSSGSGVTVSGLAKGFLRKNPKGVVYTICVSSEKAVNGVMSRRGIMPSPSLRVFKSPFAFDNVMPEVAVPFACNQFWDKKAWHWLAENHTSLTGKRVLFWNLGGEYTY